MMRKAVWSAWVVVMALGVLSGPAPEVLASTWCGNNGLVRFSFVAGDSLVTVLDSGEPENGVTMVDVYAWLTEVEPVARDGEAFLYVGGIELKLVIEGAEGFIIEQGFPDEVLNVGQSVGTVAAGYTRGQRLLDGQTLLMHWKVMFQGRPENVRFGLDSEGLVSCAGLPGCAGNGSLAIYVGVSGSNQLDAMFGAGYVPSWLNPADDPDQTPVTGSSGWRQVGVFTAR